MSAGAQNLRTKKGKVVQDLSELGYSLPLMTKRVVALERDLAIAPQKQVLEGWPGVANTQKFTVLFSYALPGTRRDPGLVVTLSFPFLLTW